MIIVSTRSGQLANRLFHFSHFIANNLDNKHLLIYPYFEEYKKFFVHIENDGTFLKEHKIRLQFTSNKVINAGLKLICSSLSRFLIKLRITNFSFFTIEFCAIVRQPVNMNTKAFRKKAITRVVFSSGWAFRDYENFKKYSSDLKKIFQPKKEYWDKVEKLESYYRNKSDILIGVHLRRGDYKNYKNGKYFYSYDTYKYMMKQVQTLLKGKKCIFIITSNEPVNSNLFNDLNIVNERNSAIVDLCLLSKSDYIIGPPSTFSSWASFFGNTPLCFIENPDQIINFTDFKVISG